MIPDLDPKDSLGRDPWAPAEVARRMTGPLEKGGGALSLGCQCGHLAIAMPPSWPWSRHVHLPSHLSRALVTTCVRPPAPRPGDRLAAVCRSASGRAFATRRAPSSPA